MYMNRRGFTLLETLLYLAIFAIVGASLFGILTNVLRVTTKEVSGDEVSSQLQFAMGTITRLVKDSSAIEISTSTATTLLKLRMPLASQDPTCVTVVNGALKLAQGPDSFNKQNCTATTTDLTTNKVVVDSILFKKNEFPGGHDQVAVDMQLSNIATGANKISRALRSGISRASAATFDSDLLPNADAQYEVGSSIVGGKRWKNAVFSGVIGVGTTNLVGGIKMQAETPDGVWGVGLTRSGSLVGGLHSNGGILTLQSATGGAYMAVANNGNVGIGVLAPAYQLEVNGNSANNTGVWAVRSDERLKRDIIPIIGALQTVTALQGVGFNWKDNAKNDQYGRVMGFIAQDVERVLPQWVKTDADGYKRLETIGMDALLVESIKEQQKQIERLTTRITELESKR